MELGATQRGQVIAPRLWKCLCTYSWPQFHSFYKNYLSRKINTSLQLCCNIWIKDHFSNNVKILPKRNSMSILPDAVAFRAGFHKVTSHLFPPGSNSSYSEKLCYSPNSTLNFPLREAHVLTANLCWRRKSRTAKGKEPKGTERGQTPQHFLRNKKDISSRSSI